MKDKAVYAAEWLRKADNDLMAARAVLESEYAIVGEPPNEEAIAFVNSAADILNRVRARMPQIMTKQ